MRYPSGNSIAFCAALLASAALAVSFCSPCVAETSEFPTNEAAARLLYEATVQSISRRFMVIGMDRSQNYQAAKWAELYADRVERAVGMLLPEKRWRTFRLILTDASPKRGEPWADASVDHDGHRWVYRLLLRDAAHAPAELVSPVLARLLLSAYVADARVSLPDGDVGNPPLVPEWVAAGLLDTMDPMLRERSAQAAFAEWEGGRLPLLGDFLRKQAEAAEGSNAPPAMAALVVRWLEVQPDRRETFRRLFDALATGKPLDVPAMAVVMGEGSAADLLDAWDEWVVRQKRIVHRPGVMTPLALERFKAQLLLYPDYSARALSGLFDEPLAPAQLLDHRKEPWLAGATVERCAAIRMAALGRGAECARVAALYCAFFEGLVSKTGDRRLRQMLEEADAALLALEKSVGGADADRK